jgi:hypothetical protein
MMPLFKRRKELERIAQLEKEGQSFWTDSFSETVKNKLLIAFVESTRQHIAFQEAARGYLLKDFGRFYLLDSNLRKYEDFQRFFLNATGEDFVSVIEASQRAIHDPSLHEYRVYLHSFDYFRSEVNRILLESRVSYKLIGNEMVEHRSQIMFNEILEPVLVQTSNKAALNGINRSFSEALAELARGKTANSITDASRSLEEALRFVGATGSGTGELFKDARKRGILKPHDQPLFDVIAKAMAWVGAQRSNEGDAHAYTDPSSSEAWATIYICGALILRILEPAE